MDIGVAILVIAVHIITKLVVLGSLLDIRSRSWVVGGRCGVIRGGGRVIWGRCWVVSSRSWVIRGWRGIGVTSICDSHKGTDGYKKLKINKHKHLANTTGDGRPALLSPWMLT